MYIITHTIQRNTRCHPVRATFFVGFGPYDVSSITAGSTFAIIPHWLAGWLMGENL